MAQKLDPQLQKLLNDHANLELVSCHKYLIGSLYVRRKELSRINRFFLEQSEDERKHALDFYDFIHKKNGVPEWKSIQFKKVEINSVVELFQLAYEAELDVSNSIQNLAKISLELNDFETHQFILDYAKLQVDEVNTAGENLELAKDFSTGKALDLHLLDREFQK